MYNKKIHYFERQYQNIKNVTFVIKQYMYFLVSVLNYKI